MCDLLWMYDGLDTSICSGFSFTVARASTCFENVFSRSMVWKYSAAMSGCVEMLP